MKKILIFLSFFVSAVAFSSQEIGEKIAQKTMEAEVLFYGANFQIDEGSLPADFKVNSQSKKNVGGVYQTRDDKWKTLTLSGTANANGNLRIMLRSQSKKGAVPVYFDNLKINGQLVANGDFSSESFDGWFLSKEKKTPELKRSHISENNGTSAYSRHGRFIARDIKVNSGDKLEISVDVLSADSWTDSHFLDLTNYYNVVLGDKQSFIKNAKAPTEQRLYGGMKFNFIDRNGTPNIAYLKYSESAKFEFGKSEVEGKYLYILYAAEKFKFPEKGTMIVRVNFRDGRKMTRYFRYGEDLKYFSENVQALDNALPIYVDNKKKNVGGVYIARCDLVGGGGTSLIETIEFNSRADIQILGATISSREIFTTEILKYPEDKWVEIDTSDMEVKEGSALDVSYQVDHAPAGKYGRVVVGKNGTFEFEKRPGVPVRFKGANFYRLICQIGNEIKTHKEIDEYVKMLKKQGFNALRWRFANENKIFDKENGIKKEYWDLYDYLLYALGREGIYSYFYLASHDIGAPDFKWNERTAAKMRMMLGYPEVRQAWRKYAKMQLEHINPYTKLAWKDDPSIATIEYWNEIEHGFGMAELDSKARKLVMKRFHDFLRKRYNNDINKFLEYSKSIKYNLVASKKQIRDFSDIAMEQYHPDRGRFAIYLMQDMQEFFRKVVVDEIGMKVPTFQHNVAKNLFWTHCAVSTGSATAINSYHDITMGSGIGSKNKQISSIHNAGNYWRGTFARNIVGMPMSVTEYQHCYPNKYCHELGLMFPTYSAFQDIAGLMAFDTPVAKTSRGLRTIGQNPIHRVNDFLTNFFYVRGDVQPSKNRVDVVFKKSFFQNSPFATGGLLQDQSKIGLITGLKLNFPDIKKVPEIANVKVKKPTIAYEPSGVSRLRNTINASTVAEVWQSTFSWDKVMADLKAKRIITANNRTDPKNEIFETDNKQIYMDCKNRILQVNTPKSVGTIVNPDSKNLLVGSLFVKSANVNASVALVAIDNKKIENSSRLVLTFATDVVLKSSKYSISRTQLLDYGKPPILLETGKIEVAIKTNGKSFTVYPLKMNGERMKPIESTLKNGALRFAVDNRKTPAVYFEIVGE